MSYMKPTKDFRLSKTSKRMIGLMRGKTKEERDGWKRTFIQAELAEKAASLVKFREPKGEE